MTSIRAATYFILVVGAVCSGIWLTGEDSNPVKFHRQVEDLKPMQKVPSVRGSESGSVAPKAQTFTPLYIRLSGVIGGGNGLPLALVSVNDIQNAIVRVGDKLDASSTVIAIDQDSMTYRQGTREIRTFVQSASDKSAPTAQRTLSPNESGNPPTSTGEIVKLPGFMPSAPSIRQTSGIEAPTGNAVFRQAIEAKIANMRAQP